MHGCAGVSTLEKVTMMVIRLGQVLLLSMVSMASAQTTAEEKWRHALMASQIFVSGAGMYAGFVARATLKMLSKRQSRSGRNFFIVARTLSGGAATVNQ